MTSFDANPSGTPPEQQNDWQNGERTEQEAGGQQVAAASSGEPPASPLAGDPITFAAQAHSTDPIQQAFPEDLRIGWSWVHLLVFLLFAVSTQLVVGMAVVSYFAMGRRFTQEQLKQFVESDPKVLFTTTILWAGLVFLFLYVTIGVLRGLPFWRSMGWKSLNSGPVKPRAKAWMYFATGCGLSIFVAIAGSRVKDMEHAPIQEFMKNRDGAILLMCMAVLFAPLFEETLFRGYLYPVLARISSAVAQFFGMKLSNAVPTGIATSILITGALFGLMHGAQLGWSWGVVSLLILVGMVFTMVRAWTGTVLTSFLLHLGYNSMIALTAVVETHGFTQMPLGH